MSIVPHSRLAVLQQAKDDYAAACRQADEANAEHDQTIDDEYYIHQTRNQSRVDAAWARYLRAEDRRLRAYDRLQVAYKLVGAAPVPSYPNNSMTFQVCDNVRG